VEPPHACEQMRTLLEDAETALAYDPRYREYSIAYTDSASVQLIDYCPFCGVRLPDSLRDEYFARLDELGIEPFSDDVPPEMRDDRWWRG
jgi:hypothetical protein